MTLIGASDNSSLHVLPLGMPNSEVVLKCEDQDSVVTELEDLCSSSETNFTPAAINVENSKDVIIGPVTQFHGPVTIYQNVTHSAASGGAIENGSATNNDLNGIKLNILFIFCGGASAFLRIIMFEHDKYNTK